MYRGVAGRLVTEAGRVQTAVRLAAVSASGRSFSDAKAAEQRPFDGSLLELLVCPLSKKPLRYEAETNELINEELGIAYPVIDGIPNMIPQEARLLQKDPEASSSPTRD